MAKFLRDIEVENGGVAPRIHSMDEYFMTEVEKVFLCLHIFLWILSFIRLSCFLDTVLSSFLLRGIIHANDLPHPAMKDLHK